MSKERKKCAPANNSGMVCAAAWRAEPSKKTTTAASIDPLRPKRSAMGPLIRDPNQAVKRSVDTNQPLKPASVAMRGKSAAKRSMARTPETTP